MKCSPKLMKYTGYLHIIALIVAIYGTFRQIDDVKAGNATSPALAVALTIMLLLRVPNQICVAFKESHGKFTQESESKTVQELYYKASNYIDLT